MSELQNGALGDNPETFVTERSDESTTQIPLNCSIVHTTTRYGRKVKPPNRYTLGKSSNFSYNLGSSQFDKIEKLPYHSDYFDHERPKRIEEDLSFPGKWHFALKRNSEGELIRHKAKYVPRGFNQKQGVDYDQTYCPTVIVVTF